MNPNNIHILSADELRNISGGNITSHLCRCGLTGRKTTENGYQYVAIELSLSESSQLNLCNTLFTCTTTCKSICESHSNDEIPCIKYLAQYNAFGHGVVPPNS